MNNLRNYCFNVKKIFELISNSDKDKCYEREITDSYGLNETGVLTQLNKMVREIKSNNDAQIDNIKYDLIKMFISVILNSEDITDIESLDFSESLCFNTLLKEGLLIEID